MKVLIAGGAGYIGATTAHLFKEAGHEAVILDDLSTGHQRNVEGFEVIEGDRGHVAVLKRAFQHHEYDVVLDFAAKIQVEESMRLPKEYYLNNTFGTLALADAT